MGEMRWNLPGDISGQSVTVSICDPQAKLNGSRSASIGDGAEATGQRSATSGTASRLEWVTQGRGESAGCLVDVPVEDVEKLCLEVDVCIFSK